jgi:hypothetical protein
VKGLSGASKAALVVAALLASLSLVAWRQGRALAELRELDRLGKEIALAGAHGGELRRTIQYLESYGRVIPAARARLGMDIPDASEIVFLPVERR